MKRKNTIWALVGATVGDRIVTVPNLHLEANPIVNTLGASVWILLTIIALGIAVYLWYRMGLWESRIALACVSILTGLTVGVVTINLIVLL